MQRRCSDLPPSSARAPAARRLAGAVLAYKQIGPTQHAHAPDGIHFGDPFRHAGQCATLHDVTDPASSIGVPPHCPLAHVWPLSVQSAHAPPPVPHAMSCGVRTHAPVESQQPALHVVALHVDPASAGTHCPAPLQTCPVAVQSAHAAPHRPHSLSIHLVTQVPVWSQHPVLHVALHAATPPASGPMHCPVPLQTCPLVAQSTHAAPDRPHSMSVQLVMQPTRGSQHPPGHVVGPQVVATAAGLMLASGCPCTPGSPPSAFT